MKGKKKQTVKFIFTVVLWILVLLAALFPARYINSVFGYAAFFFLLLLLVFSLLILFAVRRRIGIETNVTDAHSVQCLRGDPVELGLKVKNDSVFFCPRAKGGFYISDLFGGVDTSADTDFTIAARSDSGFDFGMDMKHIGVYRVGLKDLRVYDMFGFFSLPVPVRGDFEVYVKPRIRTMDELVIEEEIFLDSSRDSRNTVPNGIDYVGVREYTPGDSMKQIHWKLSAHSLGYMTKLSESTRQSDFAVVLDFAADPAEREELMDLYDTLVETAFSLLEELSHREVTYSLIYSDKQQEIRRSVPKGRENDMEYIRRFGIITPEPEPGYPDGARLVSQEARMPNRCTNLILCTSRLTSELVQEMISVRRQKRSPELYFIFPERLDRRERENLMAPLRSLDDAGVPWHAVSTVANRQPGSMPSASSDRQPGSPDSAAEKRRSGKADAGEVES